MNQHPKLVWLALAVFVTMAPARAASVAPVWPPATDLPPDPAVHAGRLPNGLIYAVRANPEPRGRASLRLLVRAGSLHETEEQRGLAHYLEHMGFNGTRAYPGASIVEFLQRQGMDFGADNNASTSFERTTYLLELPRTDETAMREGLGVLREYGDGMSLDPQEIEDERGIIFAEKRARDSVEFRTMLAEYEFILPGTLPPERFPIGVAETIEGANRERLFSFYQRWYRPDNMALVVVGDIDPAATIRSIEEVFSSMRAEGPLPAAPELGNIAPVREPQARVHREPEASTATVAIDIVHPYTKQPDSVAERLRDLPRNIANAIINRRLERLAKRENSPFTYGGTSASEFLDFATIASIELSGPPARWREALALAEQELRRALQFGFAPAELKEITASMINSLEEAVRSAPTRRSSGLASALVNAIDDERVFLTPETTRDIFRPALEQLTVDDCVRALREVWSGSAPRIFISGRLAESDTAELVLATFRESAAVAVTPPDEIKDEAFAYTDFGPPGEVVSREHVPDLDLTLVRFANGVRLNLKRTDFQANSITFRARLGGGTLQLPRDRPELARISGALVNDGGLGEHDVDSLDRILAGRTVRVGFGIGEDAFAFSGGTSPKDLELALQLLCAYLTDPGLREDILPRIRRGIEQSYERMLHTPAGIANLEVPRLLASGDPRFGMPPLEKLLAVTAEDARAWLMPIFATGALEVAIVGDLDVEQTIALAARTVGALGPRAPKPAFAEARQLSYPAEPPVREFTVETEIQKALVLVVWPTDDGFDIPRTRRLGLLSSVFSDRLRKVIREELAAAYSPSASVSPSDTYPNYGLFTTAVEVDPPQAQLVQDRILEIAAELQRNGVTEDELQRAREPVLTQIRESWRQNSYWLGSVLSRAQEKPEYLNHARTRQADFESIGKAELDALATRVFENSRAARFIIRPANPPASAPTAPSGPTMPPSPPAPAGP